MLDDLRRALRMDSPSPRLSESNLRKLSRGLRSSKKSRLSIHSTMETQSVQDGSLGNRSVSLSTLLPSGNGQGPVQRVDKLQSLEAKMASIEVSLGWRRRREALLETLPRAARELVRELDALHQTVREKENCIQGLRTQITNLGGTVSGVGDGAGGFVVSESERKTIQERLEKVESEIESKKVTVKNLKIALDKIDITDNIDVRIRAAELEYELEREELNILNLKEEASVLNTRLQESCLPPSVPIEGISNCQVKSRTPLYEYLTTPGNTPIVSGMSLVPASVSSTPGNPPFHVTFRPPYGCVIDWATDDTRLKKSDRLIEINGEIVFGKSIEDVTKIMSSCQNLSLVVARPYGDNLFTTKKLEKQIEEKNKENKELTNRLEKSNKEKDLIKNDNTRLNHRISYLEDQVNELQATLQKAKDEALINGSPNEILTPTQPGATIIQVFQKGHQTLAVAAPSLEKQENRVQEYPTLPRIKSPSSGSSKDLEDEEIDSESLKTNDSGKTNSVSNYETSNGNHHHESDSSANYESRNGHHQNSSTSYSKKAAISKCKQSKESHVDDYSDYQSINVMFKQNSDLKQIYKTTNDDYDCIEKLRDKLTEKSPSYSYSSTNSEKYHRKMELIYHKHSPHYECIYSEPNEPVYEKLVRNRERGRDSKLTKKEEEILNLKENERRTQRKSNIYERPSRRVVSPGSDDFGRRRPRPIPPKKPERLSLHRTTSMQSMDDTRCSSKASIVSNASRNTKLDRKQHQSSENIYSCQEKNVEKATETSIPENDSYRSISRVTTVSEESPIIPAPRNFLPNNNRVSAHSNNNKEQREHSYSDQTKTYESPYAKQTPYIFNGNHQSYSRSKSPDTSFHLDVTLGLDLHEDVRAQPLHDYLYQTVESLSNIQKSQQLLKQNSAKGNEKVCYDAPPTPSTPPRGKNLSLKNRGKEGEEWC